MPILAHLLSVALAIVTPAAIKKGPKPQFLHITVTLSNAGYLEFVSLFCWNGATAATIFHSLRYFHCEQGKAEAASSLQFNKKETPAKETLAQVSSSEFC